MYLNFVYQPLHDAHGAVTSVAAVATDVTAQVQDRKRVQELNEQLASINGQLQTANAELGTSNQQLTRTNVDLDNFIYTASHDKTIKLWDSIKGTLISTLTAHAHWVNHLALSTDFVLRTAYHDHTGTIPPSDQEKTAKAKQYIKAFN